MTEKTLKDWALTYARMGLAVFPLRPGDKRPATENGCKAATTSLQQIADWWDRYPDCNIGIATGGISGGLVVIDLDIDETKGINGYDSLKEWQRKNGELPETWQSITGRGGYHLLYMDSAENKNRVGLYEGVDIRGEGGYIVAPPSIHPNGRKYEWEQGPDDFGIAQADSKVINFLMGPAPDGWQRQVFSSPEIIPEGERTSTMIRLIGSLKTKGLDDEAIQAAVRAENEKKCVPPLTDLELVRTVFPAISRGWKAERPYTATCNNGKFRPAKETPRALSLEVTTMDNVEEKSPDWLILDYIPKYQITSLAGDGGSGKTTVWCALAAAVSSGRTPFLLNGLDIPFKDEPQKVMFFSAEDSYEYTLKRRLRKNGAKMENLMSIDIADERFQDVKLNSSFLEQLLEKYRPALCIFDPIQAFVPPDIRMGDRNAMRSCMAPLIGHGEKYGTTFLIIEHANKQSGVWGRKRIADSADIWDISRSVIMAGETNEKGIRYLSHEKSNYGPTAGTILYMIEDEVIKFKGYTEKKDKDFVTEVDYNTRQRPQKDEAKEFILDFLQDGEKEVSELNEMASAMSISGNALRNAKTELKKEKKVHTWSIGYGQNKKYFLSLIDTGKTNE
jgi:RecA-family ATPase